MPIERRRADDARRRPRLAAGRRRGGDPRRRARSCSARPRSARGCSRPASGAGASRSRGRPRDPRRRRAESRASATRVHRPLDPRAERILELADERGVSGHHVALARALRERGRRGLGRAAADERRDADRRRAARPRLSGATVKAVPILARTAGLLAHLAEEQEQPLGFLLAAAAAGGRGRVRAAMLEPEVETRPWEEQLALDDESYREQLAYLLERSAFYREKLAGLEPRRRSPRSPQLPLTDKDELRADRTPDEPDRRAPLRCRRRRSSASTRRAARRARRATSR